MLRRKKNFSFKKRTPKQVSNHIRFVQTCCSDDCSKVVLYLEACVALLRLLHVHVDLADGHEHVELEGENGARHEHQKGDERGVLEVGDLELGGPELDAPADGRLNGRRLEAHRLPVGRLDVLEVVGLDLVVDVQLLAVHNQRIADEQVRDVVGHGRVDAVRHQVGVDLLVAHYRQVVVLGIAFAQIVADGRVARLVDHEAVVAQRLAAELLERAVVARAAYDVPTTVDLYLRRTRNT